MAKTTRMIDVAQAAGVSLATVGRVLQGTGKNRIRVSEKTASRIQKIAQKMNYQPNLVARQLAGKNSQTLGILMDPLPVPANSIRLAEMGRRARQRGYHLMTLHEQPEPGLINECINEFKGRGVDGLICFHHSYPGQHELVPGIIRDSGMRNVVFIDEPCGLKADFVSLDYIHLGRKMVHYHYKKGRKRIALALSDLDWYTGPRFFKGYCRGMKEIGFTSPQSLVWIGTQHLGPGFDLHDIGPEGGKKVVHDLVEREKADAIISADDYWAAEIINTLLDMGRRVPEDVAVSGSGNYSVGHYTRPRITTADLQYQKIAHLAIDILVDKIEADQEDKKTRELFIPPEIIERESA